jgi:hypothetical protein
VVQVPAQSTEHPQPCDAPVPAHAPADHWQLALHVSVSVPQLPHATVRVLPGRHAPWAPQTPALQ